MPPAPEPRRSKDKPPFWIIVFSDLSGNATEPLDILRRPLIDVDRQTLDAEMLRLSTVLSLQVANRLLDDDGMMMSVEIAIRSQNDFEPESLIDQTYALRSLRETQSRFLWMQHELANDTPFSAVVDMLLEHDLLVVNSVDTMAQDILAAHADRERGRAPARSGSAATAEAMGEGLLERLRRSLTFADSADLALAVGMIDERARLTWSIGTIAEFVLRDRFRGAIERNALAAYLNPLIGGIESRLVSMISRQLDAIVHHPKFRQLEDAWRGLYLARRICRERAAREALAVQSIEAGTGRIMSAGSTSTRVVAAYAQGLGRKSVDRPE